MDAITTRQEATAAVAAAKEAREAAVAAYDAADRAGLAPYWLLRLEAAVYDADKAVEAAQAAEAEALCRAYAQAFPTPNVLRGVALCEAGTLPWAKVAALFATAYAKGRDTIG